MENEILNEAKGLKMTNLWFSAFLAFFQNLFWPQEYYLFWISLTIGFTSKLILILSNENLVDNPSWCPLVLRWFLAISSIVSLLLITHTWFLLILFGLRLDWPIMGHANVDMFKKIFIRYQSLIRNLKWCFMKFTLATLVNMNC